MIRRFVLIILFLGYILFGPSATTRPVMVSAERMETSYPVDTPIPTLVPTAYIGPGDTPTVPPPSPTATLRNTPLPSATLRPGETSLPTLASTATIPPSPTLASSPTPGASQTPGRDLFGTENAEISGARVTPPPSETPAPSVTITPTPSATTIPPPPEGFLFTPTWFLGGLAAALVLFLVFLQIRRIQHSGEFG